MGNHQVLIVGAGPAGLAASGAAAALGATVTLCGDEPYLPYWRPRLTHCLAEPVPAEDLAIRKRQWYEQNNITVLTGRAAVGIDTQAKKVFWQDGSETSYEALVLAMGSASNQPIIAGTEGALSLKNYDDAVKIRASALAAGRAVVVGGGLLGLETAWELHAAGVEVALVERSGWLMPRQLNQEGGLYLQHRLESSGLRLIIGQDPAALQDLYRGACVVMAAGVHANLAILQGSSIATGRGITVDDHMRTSISGVYACGDLAEHMGRCWGLLPVAQEQGKVAGANAAGGDAAFEETPPSPMLKVGQHAVFSVGDISAGDGVQVLTDVTNEGYACYMLKDDRLVGAALVGNTAASTKLKKALAEKKSFVSIKSVKDLNKNL